jgi:chromosome segregation ATPase
MNHKHMFLALGVSLAFAGLAAPAAAQKHPKAKEAKERAQEKREELKENRDEKREQRDELKEKHAAKKERHQELKEKEKAGTLSDDEKAELEQMGKRRDALKAKHAELKAKHAELKKTWKKRRVDARKKVLDKWPNIRKHPAAVNEMKTHARRMAHLNRAKAVAAAEGRDDLVARIDTLIGKEQARHDRVMKQHEDKIK